MSGFIQKPAYSAVSVFWIDFEKKVNIFQTKILVIKCLASQRALHTRSVVGTSSIFRNPSICAWPALCLQLRVSSNFSNFFQKKNIFFVYFLESRRYTGFMIFLIFLDTIESWVFGTRIITEVRCFCINFLSGYGQSVKLSQIFVKISLKWSPKCMWSASKGASTHPRISN